MFSFRSWLIALSFIMLGSVTGCEAQPKVTITTQDWQKNTVSRRVTQFVSTALREKPSANKKRDRQFFADPFATVSFYSLDLAKKVRPNRLELFFVRIRIHEPKRRREAAEQRVAVLRRETGADDLLVVMNFQALRYDKRLM